MGVLREMIYIICIIFLIFELREKKKNCYIIRVKIVFLLLIKFSLGDRVLYEIEMGWDLSLEMDNLVIVELVLCRSLDFREEEKVCFL